MQDGRNLARGTAVNHNCVQSGRRPHARISATFSRRNRRSPRFRSRCRSPTRFLEHDGKSHFLESCCTIFRYVWITLMSRDKRKLALTCFMRHPSMMIGMLMEISHCVNPGSVWHDSRCYTTRPGNILPEESSNMSKVHSVKPLINGRKKKQNWTLREHKEAFYSIPDDDFDYEEILNNARRSLEIRRASALPCNGSDPVHVTGLTWKRSDWILHAYSKIRSLEHNHWIARTSKYKE